MGENVAIWKTSTGNDLTWKDETTECMSETLFEIYVASWYCYLLGVIIVMLFISLLLHSMLIVFKTIINIIVLIVIIVFSYSHHKLRT